MSDQEYEVLKNDIRTRLLSVQNDVEEALLKSGRQSDSVTLIGVTKYFPQAVAQAAFELGIKDLGENRVQELLQKEEALSLLGIHPDWHLIGTLQTNKVRHIIGHTKLIHSVASEDLLMEIQKRSLSLGITTPILLQVNISQEDSKHGFCASDMHRMVDAAARCSSVLLRGMMTMAPIQQVSHDALPYFQKTQELFHLLQNEVSNPSEWKVLSMGMSQDYIDAIQCGATHIRLGTAIFGHRS
jgi:pyridoxal phosphate enzyme (YggS family)